MSPSRFKHAWTAALVVAALAAGCGGSTVNLFPDVTPSEDTPDAASPDVTNPPDIVTPPDGSGGRCASNADCRADQFCAGMGCGTPGVCQTRPQACPEIFSPVCGCDGRTYAAAECEANANGVRVASRGPCGGADGGVDGGPRTCRTAADCGTSGAECVFPVTGCATTGVCMLPTPCFRAETFCGCDGVTYEACRPTRPNRAMGPCGGVDAGLDAPPTTCRADRDCAAGQACCAATGRCYDTRCLSCCMFPPPDAGVDAPPAACRANSDCGAGRYCAGMGCGTAGTCAARPTACPDLYSPVCGCDGRTYGNDCEAAGAGVRVSARGMCPTADAGVDVPRDVPGAFCPAALCGPGTYCCEARRACIPVAEACSTTGTCTNDTQCAGPSYACCAGTGRCYAAACLSCCMPTPTGCASNADCRATQYCAGTGCGTRGTCADRPMACTTLYAPVCGCDGRTYSNECVANAAGQRAASRGECTAVDAGADAAVDASATRCSAASDCGRGQECVYPSNACVRDGVCMGAIACLIPNTYCSCSNVTYQGCRPDRPTQSTGACASTSFCATARCTSTTYCCEARRACIPLAEACSTTGTCTNDTQCAGPSYACCAGTGRCYAAACLGCCMATSTNCASNADCRATQYCAGTGCGTRGNCTDRPTICTRELNPQCGCDRMTYTNPCAAAAAGVRVASAGACM